MSDEEDAKFLQDTGVATPDRPCLQKYFHERNNLIQQEKSQRADHAFRANLSPVALQACAIVSHIRSEEQQTIWNSNFVADQTQDSSIHPGMMFSLARERMESTKLWKIVQRMPKGALLHCHLVAMGDHPDLIHAAIRTPGMVMRAEAPLATAEDRNRVTFNFTYQKAEMPESSLPSIWSSKYPANTNVPLSVAASTFPGANSIESFVQWFISRTTITHNESISHHLGPNDIWQKFRSTFKPLAGLQLYEPLFRRFVARMLKAVYADGIRWVDIRTGFASPFTREGASAPDTNAAGMLSVFREEIDTFKASSEGQGFWGARLIWTGFRGRDSVGVIKDMIHCIEMKLQYPELICGYDIAGPEHLGRSLVDMAPELLWFRDRCVEKGVEIPLFLHAGETLGDGDLVDDNLFDAIVIGARRIGHAFSLYKHPLLVEMVKKRNVLVESCPISNEILRLTSSVMTHSLPALLARGVSCALGNDDPTILGHGSPGMTHDFWQAIQGWDNLGLEGLASLAENSVRWAAFEDCSVEDWAKGIQSGVLGSDLRAQRMQEWSAEFEKFCAWVVEEFGAGTSSSTLE